MLRTSGSMGDVTFSRNGRDAERCRFATEQSLM